jgi:hypothetical protein
VELVTRTAKLLPYLRRPKQATGYATAYYHEPDAYDPIELGNLFAVVEVAGSAHEQVAELIIQTFADSYYQVDDLEQMQAVSQFEQALKAINQELEAYSQQTGSTEWMSKLSCILAAFSQGEIHLSQAGSAKAFLFRQGQLLPISDDASTPPEPGKTFCDIASGQLRLEDRVLIATSGVLLHVSTDELKTLMNGRSANAAIEKLASQVQSVANVDRIAALAVEVTSADLLAQQSLPSAPAEMLVGDKPSLWENLQPVIEAFGSWLRTAAHRLSTWGRSFWATAKPRLHQVAQTSVRTAKRSAHWTRKSSVQVFERAKRLRQKS